MSSKITRAKRRAAKAEAEAKESALKTQNLIKARQKSEASEGNHGIEHHECSEMPPPVSPPVPRVEPDPEKAKTTNDNADQANPKWEGFFAARHNTIQGAGVFLTALVLGVYACQWYEMRRTVNEMQTQRILDERPWVTVDSQKLWTTQLPGNAVIDMTLLNTGKTPAYLDKVGIILRISHNDKDWEEVFTNWIAGGSAIAPSRTLSLGQRTLANGTNPIFGITNWTKWGAAQGRHLGIVLEYHDAFKSNHVTEACFFIIKNPDSFDSLMNGDKLFSDLGDHME